MFMKCDKCGQDATKIDNYVYRYGKETGRTSRIRINQIETTEYYKVGGLGNNNICDNCIWNIRKYNIQITPIFFALGVLSYMIGIYFRDVSLIITIILGLLGTFFMFGTLGTIVHIFTRKRTIGSEIAVSLNKKALRGEGYDSFFVEGSTKTQFKKY